MRDRWSGRMLAASFVNLATVEKGYDPRNVLAFQLVLPGEYPTARKAESIEAVLGAVRALPGVTVAGFAYAGILIGIQDTVGSFVPPGRTLDSVAKEADRPRLKSLSAGYLEATGATLLGGRLLAENDAGQAATVAVINRTTQRRYFGDASPVGASMDWHGGRGPHVPVRIVGVVADVRQGSLSREPYPEVFMDYRQVIALQQQWDAPKALVDQLAFGFMSFAMRTRDDPAAVVPQVRHAIARADRTRRSTRSAWTACSECRRRHGLSRNDDGVRGSRGVLAAIGSTAFSRIRGPSARGRSPRRPSAHGRRTVLARAQTWIGCAAIGIVLGMAGAAVGNTLLQALIRSQPRDGRRSQVALILQGGGARVVLRSVAPRESIDGGLASNSMGARSCGASESGGFAS